MVPVISGKVEKRQQCFAILDQAFDGLVVFRRVFLGECRNRRLRRRPVRRQPDFVQVFVRIGLNGFRKLVENVQRLVQPAAFEGKASSRAFQKPSAPSPTATSGAIDKPRAFKSTSNSFQLCTLSRMPVWKPINSFLPSGVAPISTSMHSACGSIRQLDAVRPHVNVAARRQSALLPPLILVFPLALEPGDHCRREVWHVLAEQGRENLLKIARRNPAPIESWAGGS